MQPLELDGSQLAGVEKHALSFLQLSLVTLSCKVMLILALKCNAKIHMHLLRMFTNCIKSQVNSSFKKKYYNNQASRPIAVNIDSRNTLLQLHHKQQHNRKQKRSCQSVTTYIVCPIISCRYSGCSRCSGVWGCSGGVYTGCYY